MAAILCNAKTDAKIEENFIYPCAYVAKQIYLLRYKRLAKRHIHIKSV